MMNWLRVLGTAELPHIDQGVRQHFHANMSLLHVFKTQEEPLECIFPRKGPIDTSPQGMDSFVEEPLPSSLGALAVAWILLNVGEHARIEHARAMVRGIKTCIKIEIRTCQHHTCHVGHALQCVQSIRSKHHIRFIDWSDRKGRQHIAMVVGDNYDFLALLVLLPRVPDAITPFLATVLVPSPCSTLTSSCCSAAR